MYGLRNSGLGSKEDLPKSIFGGNVDCRNLMTYIATPECWDYTREAWRQMVAFDRPTSAVIAPPPAVGEALSKVPAPYTTAEYNAAVDAAIAAGKEATDENVREFFKGATQPGPEDGGVPLWVWMAGAGAFVFALVAVSGGSPRRYGR
jgi:hypothetical protein